MNPKEARKAFAQIAPACVPMGEDAKTIKAAIKRWIVAVAPACFEEHGRGIYVLEVRKARAAHTLGKVNKARAILEALEG